MAVEQVVGFVLPLRFVGEEEFGQLPQRSRHGEPLALINMNMCGEWAGPIWQMSGGCVNTKGPLYPSQCSIVDPIGNQSGLGDDCCTQFVVDKDGK